MAAGSVVRVVIVDDDQDYLEALKGDLADRGFEVCTYSDGECLLQSPEVAAQAHLIVLDWSMPYISGINLLQRLRQIGVKAPIIFLTGRSLVESEQAGLTEGAVDFIDKARGVDVLVRRLGRLDAFIKPTGTSALRLGSLVLLPDTARAEWRGRDVDLTRTQYKIVVLLAGSPGRFATYRTIYDIVHYVGFFAGQGHDGIKTNVRSNIKRLRAKFLRIDPSFDEIVNHSRIGYAWREPARSEAPLSTA